MNKIRQIGDKVWILENNKIKECTVKHIYYGLSYKEFEYQTTQAKLGMKGMIPGSIGQDITHRNPDMIFSSKEELIESLSK